MEEIIKQDKNKSHSEFEKLLADDLQKRDFKEGSIVEATIEEIGKKFVFVKVEGKVGLIVKDIS